MDQLNAFENVKLIEKLENYFKREQNDVVLSADRDSSNNNINSTSSENNDTMHGFKLNFEYSFFKLTKLVLVDDSLITNENDFKLLMRYCFDKTIQQYNLFQIQNDSTCDSGDDDVDNFMDDFDEQDEFNLIEL